MERPTPARKTSTADFLTWPEAPSPDSSSVAVSDNVSRSAARSYQPSDGVSKVLFGGQITEEEAESFNKRKPCYEYKMQEITRNYTFSTDGEDGVQAFAMSDFNSSNRTSVRMVQNVTIGSSQISFNPEEDVSPKKPITLPEVAKQRELSGTLGDSDDNNKKQLSDAKCKELSGHDIFAPTPEVPARSAARTFEPKVSKVVEEPPPAPRNVHTSVKVSNPSGGQSSIMFGDEPETKTTKKIHNQKFAELTGNNIFQEDISPGAAEKQLSMAKRKEMDGSNIFADGKAAPTDYLRGVRHPPGGESSISLT